MITHLRGTLSECNPAYVVVDCGGVGYYVSITLTTYEAIKGLKEVLLYTEHLVREDNESLFGFFTREERDMFRLLLTVAGIGAATARMILSAMSHRELTQAIASGDVRKLKSVKGVGEKSAQRIIVDLKDKVSSLSLPELGVPADRGLQEEALAALATLGFSRSAAEKAMARVPDASKLSLEMLIKETLKNL
ncbi:MAG: Holliday junction branch migration protein RuvA [Flavobacteriales bacterium]|nr:Holliday junction branch migration protein RuvA [Flavobacteriales bacterium]MCX7767892.1 Holliday junction branch migration protein RuvA [Flavobacteriales bacterium]MDW8409296.1 Holliday junction branch migration protein RuvA [Flavobacteriales bacterium]